MTRMNTTINGQWLSKPHTYEKGSLLCQLCLAEKTQILMAEKENLLNQRNEILNPCRHRKKLLLEEFKRDKPKKNKPPDDWKQGNKK